MKCLIKVPTIEYGSLDICPCGKLACFITDLDDHWPLASYLVGVMITA